jgi:Flp pilus assembly protein TadG
MLRKRNNGQAILLVVVAMGIFLIGALGLAIDVGHMYGHRQMAQVAADAAAQAGILSILNGTNVGSNAFGSSTHTCTTADPITPCAHARKDGFGGAANDVVVVDFPSAATVGLDPATLSTSDPVNVLRVTITRSVTTGLIRLLGAASASPVRAIAAAAIVAVDSPTPIIVTHPTMAHALSTNGTTNIIICGGPTRSIQVNSANGNAYASPKAGGVIDLSHAGPADTGNCAGGTGADFGVLGGDLGNPGSVVLGSTGHYVSPSSVVDDPFKGVAAPPAPAPSPTNSGPVSVPSGTDGCAFASCNVYYPGLYTSGLRVSGGNPVIFRPGLYYLRTGGFQLKNVDGGGGVLNNWSAMCRTCGPDASTGMGMVVYDTGPSGAPYGSNPTGGFDISTNVRATLKGGSLTTTNASGEVVPAPPYYNFLFWEDRTANTHSGSNPTSAGGSHSMGQGNGCFTLIGTIYATNNRDAMIADADHYQEVIYNGNPCSTTVQQGYIVVSSLQIVGTTTIRMNLSPYGFLKVRQIALVR